MPIRKFCCHFESTCFLLPSVVSFSEQCVCSDANLFHYEAISIVCDLMDLPIKAIKKNPQTILASKTREMQSIKAVN